MIQIDGSYGEGGGQIIRTALALSALTQKPFEITKIRYNRQQPGLKAQHLTATKAVADICDADVTGAEIGSTKFTFVPKKVRCGKYNWNIGTAGSVTLVLQALLPAALHSGKEFEFVITGGTNVQWSPPVEHFQHVFCDYLKKMNAKIQFSVEKYGFYPKGGGLVKFSVMPSQMKALDLRERGKLKSVDIWSIASEDLKKAAVAQRQIEGFKKFIKETVKTNEIYVKSNSTGSCIHAHAHYENCKLGAEALGEKNIRAEKIGETCAERLEKEMKGDSTTDSHMTDQTLPYLAIFGGAVKFSSLSEHARTNMWLIEQFLDVKFNIEGNTITCKV